jgi:hypothetical protein
MKRTTFPWILAIIITLAAVVYQRSTGPTYPKKIKAQINNKLYHLRLLTSHGELNNAEIKLNIPEKGNAIAAKIVYRKYPMGSNWDTLKFHRIKRKTSSIIEQKVYRKFSEEVLVAYLPKLPPAGKYEYFIRLEEGNTYNEIAKQEPIIIRYKAPVPNNVLLPHVILMFLAMLFSNLSAFLAMFGHYKARFYTIVTFLALLIGGMILGPIVQKYAFGEYWTGIPFGWDLTDNKTLIAVFFWLIAFVGNIRKERFGLIILAAIVMLLVYSVPHSLFGSTLDHVTGRISQGIIYLFIN